MENDAVQGDHEGQDKDEFDDEPQIATGVSAAQKSAKDSGIVFHDCPTNGLLPREMRCEQPANLLDRFPCASDGIPLPVEIA
jgi:hypothetical protein